MTDQELWEISNRAERATRGPWKSCIEGRDHLSGDNFIMTGIKEGDNIWSQHRGTDIYLSGTTNDDQDFIANSRQDIPRLIDEIFRLRKEIESIKGDKK